MAENKDNISETKSAHHHHHGHHHCHCGHGGSDYCRCHGYGGSIGRVILALIISVVLLCIGAALGAHFARFWEGGAYPMRYRVYSSYGQGSQPMINNGTYIPGPGNMMNY